MKKDIYYNVYYGKLYENTEHGKLETFEVDSEYGKIEHIFIKREIEMNTERKYYDIVTHMDMAVLLSQNVTIKKNYWHSLKRTLQNIVLKIILCLNLFAFIRFLKMR